MYYYWTLKLTKQNPWRHDLIGQFVNIKQHKVVHDVRLDKQGSWEVWPWTQVFQFCLAALDRFFSKAAIYTKSGTKSLGLRLVGGGVVTLGVICLRLQITCEYRTSGLVTPRLLGVHPPSLVSLDPRPAGTGRLDSATNTEPGMAVSNSTCHPN